MTHDKLMVMSVAFATQILEKASINFTRSILASIRM